MKPNLIPDQELLKEFLEYTPETGYLTWKERKPEHFLDGKYTKERKCGLWNGRLAGKQAGCDVEGFPYRMMSILSVTYYEHRVIWKWMTGEDPDTIDHINRNKKDNSWDNLRSVTSQENGRNKPIAKNNTSKTTGVFWEKRRARWEAGITLDGRSKYLGHFQNKEEAIEVRKAAEVKYGFHENHGKVLAHEP